MCRATCDASQSLLEKTRALLLADDRSLWVIAHDFDIPFHWLRKFATNDIPNPGVNRVQYLFERLTGEELKV